MPRSVLDDLGEEITGIVAPVSICMALVVVLVKALNPEGITDTSTVAIATIAYQEKDTDTAGQKLGGALLNAIVFMAVIAGMTFVLFLLFKWGCYKVIYGYMGFAMLNIFFFFTGALVIQLLRLIGLHVDLFSLAFLLFNFSVLGILSLFFMPVPLFLKQCYTVWVGICVAYIFTHIPEWTSWVLLVIMALYDLAAVLMPGGPLKILVELAIERQQELPALIYESRPVGRPYQRGMWRRQQGAAGSGAGSTAGSSAAAGMSGAAAAAAAAAVGLGADGSSSPAAHVALLAGQPRSSDEFLQEMALSHGTCSSAGGSNGTAGAVGAAAGPRRASRAGCGAVPLAEGREEEEEQRCVLLLHKSGVVQTRMSAGPLGEGTEEEGPSALPGGSFGEAGSSSSRGMQHAADAGDSSGRHQLELPPGPAGATPTAVQHGAVGVDGSAVAAGGGRGGSSTSGSDDGSYDMPDGIKLGLGDFIFYSMLVGRAAMYDMMTVYASYIAVISGLGITLMLLALYRKALPALPVSIALGVVFYFLTRLVMEPFVVPLSLNLAYY